MAKKVKKVDVKKVAKDKVMAVVAAALVAQGFEVMSGEEKFGFTGGTIVVRTETCDVQIKPITPKAGVERYEEVVEEVEEVSYKAPTDVE